jgi:hypothetical protein
MTYLDWNSLGKHFFLFDTFCGIPEESISEQEKNREGLNSVENNIQSAMRRLKLTLLSSRMFI